MIGVLIRRGEDTKRHRKEGHMKVEAEVGILPPQAKIYQEPPETGRGKDVFFPMTFRGSMAPLTP